MSPPVGSAAGHVPRQLAAAGARVVIAHDHMCASGGAERTAAILAAALPGAPFWTIIGRRRIAAELGVADRYHAVLPERDRLVRNYRRIAPLYPALLRRRVLPEADLLVTSSFAFAHHFRTANDAPQLCYCHCPVRLAWSPEDARAAGLGNGLAGAAGWRVLTAAVRRSDRRAARRVTRYVANSRFTAGQIERFYGIDADVVHPPVDTKLFRPGEGDREDFFLFCGRLNEIPKRPSLAVDAFRELPGERLVVAGDGPALPELRSRTGANVQFLGRVDDTLLVSLMQRCAAAIFPSRDDFGLIPVEVMACGRPVICFAGGGALETVVPGVTGEFFAEQSPAAIRDAVRDFDPDRYDPAAIRAHAERWRRERFEAEMLAAIRAMPGPRGSPRA